jgi:hypothetical protein
MASRTAALSPFVRGLLEFGISQVLGLGVFPAIGTERASLASMLVKIKIADHALLAREDDIRTSAKDLRSSRERYKVWHATGSCRLLKTHRPPASPVTVLSSRSTATETPTTTNTIAVTLNKT